jgi:hypothetical protein
MKSYLVAAAVLLTVTSGALAQKQEGLVNVGVGDVTALNDIGIANGTSVQVPVGIAAQVCPDVDANVLAKQKSDDTSVVCTVNQDQANNAFINYVKQNKQP